MKKIQFLGNMGQITNATRIAILAASGIVILCATLMGHVVDVHIPTSEDFKFESEKEENSREKDSTCFDTGDGREVEFRKDDSMTVYDNDGKRQGKAS